MAGPATGQDFVTYQGDDSAPIFTVTDNAGSPVDLSSVEEIVWQAARDAAGMASPVIQKSLNGTSPPGIALVSGGTTGQFQVTIDESDTSPLSGYYLHRARITDSNGKRTTVTLGRMQVGLPPTWTYSGDPSVSDRDQVRFAIQDTVEATPLFNDPEIDFMLTQYPNWALAAGALCRQLGAKFSAQVTNKRVGDLSISYRDRAAFYLDLAEQLTAQGETMGVTIYAGGTSKADMAAVDANPDKAFQPFALKQFDIPGSADSAQSPQEDCE